MTVYLRMSMHQTMNDTTFIIETTNDRSEKTRGGMFITPPDSPCH